MVDPPVQVDSTVIAAALDRLRGAALVPEEQLSEAVTELGVAYEELRVAEEELRTHQETIAELLAGDQRRREHQLADMLPVALLQTDTEGQILHGNPAAAQMLGLPAARLARRVLPAWVDLADRGPLRRALSALATGERGEIQVDVTLRGRDGPVRPVRLFGWVDAASTGPVVVRWLGIEAPEGSSTTAPPSGAAVAATEPVAGEAGATGMAMAQAFAELVLLPLESGDDHRLLQRIATVIRGAVPGATALSINVGPPVEPQLLASDDTVAQVFDGRQLAAGQGPCQDAYEQRAVVVTADVTTDVRWPRLRRLLTDDSVRSVLAVPAQLPDDRWVVLNVYSDRPAVFTGDSVRLGEMVAAAVAAILREVAERAALGQLAANLERALMSRAVIDQAKGVIIARTGVSAEDAFARLSRLSQALNVKLRDLAPMVVAGHPDVLTILDHI
ncbi:PAS domain S-box-containing protein [Geodermatophilus telluris]|uniref:PAS domain S-box-containing protein n=1 Tax=Geodermatophilus telluris TaxID=1190417 RepID=A0A1G6U798_9ACTN|nr:ANTAR domain-containing protein [Geodermatophilus telluris]SDD37238.1 PAS domain S-box-containing protein [Geodermatophilus telluris]